MNRITNSYKTFFFFQLHLVARVVNFSIHSILRTARLILKVLHACCITVKTRNPFELVSTSYHDNQPHVLLSNLRGMSIKQDFLKNSTLFYFPKKKKNYTLIYIDEYIYQFFDVVAVTFNTPARVFSPRRTFAPHVFSRIPHGQLYSVWADKTYGQRWEPRTEI